MSLVGIYAKAREFDDKKGIRTGLKYGMELAARFLAFCVIGSVFSSTSAGFRYLLKAFRGYPDANDIEERGAKTNKDGRAFLITLWTAEERQILD